MKKGKKEVSPDLSFSFDFFNRQNFVTVGVSLVLVLILGFSIFNYFSSVNEEGKKNIEETPSPISSESSQNKENEPEGTGKSKAETYTVKEGDSLWSIAEDLYQDGFRWMEVAQANGLTDPDTIHSGNELKIPQGQVSGTSAAATEVDERQSASSGATGGGSYIVKEGDSLWSIAEHYYGSGYEWFRIDQVNKFDKLSNGRPLIVPGQRIIIP